MAKKYYHTMTLSRPGIEPTFRKPQATVVPFQKGIAKACEYISTVISWFDSEGTTFS